MKYLKIVLITLLIIFFQINIVFACGGPYREIANYKANMHNVKSDLDKYYKKIKHTPKGLN